MKVPVIASLNGVTLGGWLEYAQKIEQAGADALELNVYYLATKAWEAGSLVERRILEMVHAVKTGVKIPVAVKLSPFFSSLGHFVERARPAKVDGLVLFNRFYQPDIDPEELEVVPSLHLSDSSELLLRLRWLAILSGRVKASLAVVGRRPHRPRRREGGHDRRRRRPGRLGPPPPRAEAPRRRSGRSSRSGWRSTSTSRSPR